LFVRPISGTQTDLARQYDIVAAARKRFADDLLCLSVRIGVRGVDNVYAGVERGMDNVDTLLFIGISIGTKHHRAQGVGAHANPGSSERAIFHLFPWYCEICSLSSLIGKFKLHQACRPDQRQWFDLAVTQ
jgi:hypothetical protein